MNSTTVVKDPVCGMDVETATAAGKTEHKGQTYYFCGSKCKREVRTRSRPILGQGCWHAQERTWLLQLNPKKTEERKIMSMPKSVFLPIVVLALMCVPSLAQDTATKPMDMKTMPANAEEMQSHMEKMRTQMAEMQAKMKDNMAKMEAADAAMKSHMATMQDNMKGEMELKHSLMDQMQMMMDHMQQMTDRMAAMSDQMDIHKKTGKTTKKDNTMMKDQKK